MVSQILSSKNLNMLMRQNLESLFALWMDKDFQLVGPSSVSKSAKRYFKLMPTQLYNLSSVLYKEQS